MKNNYTKHALLIVTFIVGLVPCALAQEEAALPNRVENLRDGYHREHVKLLKVYAKALGKIRVEAVKFSRTDEIEAVDAQIAKVKAQIAELTGTAAPKEGTVAYQAGTWTWRGAKHQIMADGTYIDPKGKKHAGVVVMSKGDLHIKLPGAEQRWVNLEKDKMVSRYGYVAYRVKN